MTGAGRAAGIAVRGVVAATAFVLLWLWLASLVRRYDPLLGVGVPGWMRPIGGALLAAGAALAMSCVALFVTRGRGTPAPFDPPRVFVASGPYRYLRNPMYAGAILALVGGGLAFGSFAVVLLGAAFWLLAHLFVLFYEEPALERRFGSGYARYKAAVSRWFPHRPSSREGPPPGGRRHR
jgi:protein-S-isoprenylcysteine O-methyltransferase Ste14